MLFSQVRARDVPKGIHRTFERHHVVWNGKTKHTWSKHAWTDFESEDPKLRSEHSIHSYWESKRMLATYMRRIRNNNGDFIEVWNYLETFYRFSSKISETDCEKVQAKLKAFYILTAVIQGSWINKKKLNWNVDELNKLEKFLVLPFLR